MRNIIIIGTGAVAEELSLFILDNNSNVKEDQKINILGYIEYDYNIEDYYNKFNFDAPVLSDIDSYLPSPNEEILIGISNINFRKKMIEILLKKKAKIGNFVHHSVIMPQSVQIGTGSIVYPFCIIEENSIIGNYNIIAAYSFIAHDSVIGNNNFFSTASLPSRMKIGDDNYFGIGIH